MQYLEKLKSLLKKKNIFLDASDKKKFNFLILLGATISIFDYFSLGTVLLLFSYLVEKNNHSAIIQQKHNFV